MLWHDWATNSAEVLINQLSQQYPLNLLLNRLSLPSAQAAISLHQNDPGHAIDELQSSTPYDLGNPGTVPDGITLYLRGVAYLQEGSVKQAATQFQRLIDYRGVNVISLYWPLAHLQLARASARSGDVDKSREEYREFLELWKDADSDVLILKQAKAEYAQIPQSLTEWRTDAQDCLGASGSSASERSMPAVTPSEV